jgi:DNA-binding response OmpR family regulator
LPGKRAKDLLRPRLVTGTPLAEASGVKRGRILVVDDDPDVRNALANALTREELEVGTASCALEALRKADAFGPDIVLCEVQMPGMSGLELMEALRVRHDELPVILMSTEPEGAHPSPAPADDYLTKPIELPRLVALLALQLEASRQRRRIPWRPGR